MSFKKEDLFEALKTLVLPEISKLQTTVDGLEVRLINVETRLDQMDKRFDQVDKRIDDLRIDTMERFSQVDKRFDQVDKRIDDLRIDTMERFSQVDKRFDQVDKRFSQVDKRFDQTDKRIDDLRIDTMERFSQVNKQFVLVNKRIDDVGDEMRSRFTHLDQSVQYLGAAVAEVRQYVWSSGVYGRTESVRQPMFVSEEPDQYSTKPTIAELKRTRQMKKRFCKMMDSKMIPTAKSQNDGRQNNHCGTNPSL